MTFINFRKRIAISFFAYLDFMISDIIYIWMTFGQYWQRLIICLHRNVFNTCIN